jgi:hypothetical protein
VDGTRNPEEIRLGAPPDDARSERPGESDEPRVSTDHGVTRGRSNVVREENRGERVSRDLGAALDAWCETPDTTSLRRALVRVLSLLEEVERPGEKPEQ